MKTKVIKYQILPIYLIMVVSVFFLMISGCGENSVTTDKDIVFPDSNISYLHHVEPFIRLKCSYRGCHSREDRAGQRDMSDYFALFSTENAGLIIPEHPEESRLIQILKSNPPHGGYFTFPKGYFNENHINGMIKWIEEGAKMN